MWDKTKDFLIRAYGRLKLIDWLSAAFSILKASKKEDRKVNDKYIVIKPRILSDENYLRGVSVLRGVLGMVPHTAIASPILGLGVMGFKVWKRIALSAEFNQLEYPPMDPNMLRVSIEMDAELKKHYGQLILSENWSDESISELEKVFNDFQFITDFQMLRVKYPSISEKYIRSRVITNKEILQTNLSAIEQRLLQVSHSAEMDRNIKEAFGMLREIFPAMNDWALFNSEGFKDILELLDTVF